MTASNASKVLLADYHPPFFPEWRTLQGKSNTSAFPTGQCISWQIGNSLATGMKCAGKRPTWFSASISPSLHKARRVTVFIREEAEVMNRSRFSASVRSKLRRGHFETLESRRLLSHSNGDATRIPPLPPNPTPVDQAIFAQVNADLATVQTDKTAVHNDSESVEAAVKAALTTAPVMTAEAALAAAKATAKPLIQADRAAIHADKIAIHDAREAVEAAVEAARTTAPVTAAKATLATTIATQTPLIQADLAAIRAVNRKDEPAVDAAEHQLRVDTRNGAAASVIAADQAALTAAQNTLATDLAGPKAQLATDKAPIDAAEAAVQAAINADPGVVAAKAALAAAQAKLTADKAQLAADKAPVAAAKAAVQAAINADPGVVAAKAMLANDQAALTAAQTQFQTDLATYIADLKAGI